MGLPTSAFIQRCILLRRRKQWGRQFAISQTWTSPSMAGFDQDLGSVLLTRMPNECWPQWTRVSTAKCGQGLASVLIIFFLNMMLRKIERQIQREDFPAKLPTGKSKIKTSKMIQ